ncbi:transcription factor bHLH143-like [Vicia villosa]|uniref:transcription factor bHLH143-like n=1 Tax=Vicia villosa TaxID=3911 RepID=UPI00273CE778|nr:transcription factor bHLH143-like [Vicia villosa]
MGENCGTWTHQVQFNQSPNLSSFCAPFDMGKQNAAAAAAMNPGVDMNMNSRNEAVPPAYASSALPYTQSGHLNEPHGWFYCLPRFRQGFTCPPNFISEDKLPPASQLKGLKEETTQNEESGFPQKQFLVIDQTGDQTTLIYSSRFGRPVECLGSWDSKFHGCNNLNANNDEPSLRRDVNHVVGVEPTFDYKVDENENQETEIESEMHEDTEEINALLYSDSDGYSTEDDEVTSTGHSPSTMTTHVNQEPYGGIAEEVASSSPGKTKKRKLFDVAYDDDVQFMDTANSLKRSRPCNLNRDEADDDAESRCSGSNYGQGYGATGSLKGTKKTRKEKIQSVLSILQCIVPNGKDKNPIQLLDDAIHCLNSLKLKARALGLHAL